jgi:xanthine dehydrogenase accessory factor
MSNPIIIRGGGDLASGVVLRLHRAGFPVIITELPQPLSVRRAVSFSEAVYEGQWKVEDVSAQLVQTSEQIEALLAQHEIPVLIDPTLKLLSTFDFRPSTIVDARLLKHPHPPLTSNAPFTIGLGPGFIAGENCHAFVETMRGHTLGRAYWSGSASADTGQPEGDPRRVLRAPANGILNGYAHIGKHLEAGQVIAEVNNVKIAAPFPGVLRGLIHSGLEVTKGIKIGDVDARDAREYCFLVSDKALAIGGGVLEAILTFQVSGFRHQENGRP